MEKNEHVSKFEPGNEEYVNKANAIHINFPRKKLGLFNRDSVSHY